MKRRYLVLFFVLSLAASSYGYYDDFSAYADGSAIVGQGYWLANNLNGGDSLQKSGSIVYDGFNFNNGPYTFAGAARNLSGPRQFDYIVTIRTQEYANGSAFVFSIGSSGLTNAVAANTIDLVYDTRDNEMYLRRHINGAYEHESATIVSKNLESYVVQQIKIAVDLDAGTANLYWRDANDITVAPIGDWVFQGTWNYALPFTSITQVGIAVSNYIYVYNFSATSVPPADCAAAIADGYGLTYDLNSDCKVDFADFATFAQDWARCVDPVVPGCETPWLNW